MIRNLFDLKLRPNTIRSVPCPYCKVRPEEDCLKASGDLAPHSHRRRVKAFYDKAKVVLVEITRGDGYVQVGERYWARSYSLDPGKLTLLQRTDGWDPERNEYRSNVRVIGWLCPSVYREYHD